MSFQLVAFYILIVLLPVGMGINHLFRARYSWGALFFLMGIFNALVLFEQIGCGKLILSFFQLAGFFVALGALYELPLTQKVRWAHELFAMTSLCLFSVLLFDVGNIRAGSLSDDTTGLIAGLIGCLVIRTIVPRR